MEVLFPGLSSALNVHPLFVHFPIVLWLTALLFWGLALWLERDVLWDMGRWLLYLGALGALAAVGTGLWAEEHLGHDSPAHDLVHVHRNWMLSTTGLGLVTAVVAFATRSRTSRGARWGLCGLLLLTVAVMTLGADRGARLVYGHGIGTTREVTSHASESASQPEEPGSAAEHDAHDHHH